MDAKTKLATAFTCAVLLAAVAWGVSDSLARRGPQGRSGQVRSSPPSQVSARPPDDRLLFSPPGPPVFHERTLRIDPSVPSDAARDFRGTNWDDSFDEIGDLGYTAEQMFVFDARLTAEQRLDLHASVGMWGNPHVF